MRSEDVVIQAPCEADWDSMRIEDGGRRRWCADCRRSVHDLSAMTEVEARRFLAATEDQSVCIAYAEGPDGSLDHVPPPQRPAWVPASRLRRPAQLAGAASLAGLLVACTPHGEPPRAVVVDDPPALESVAPVVPAQPPRAQPRAEPDHPWPHAIPDEPRERPPRIRKGARVRGKIKLGVRGDPLGEDWSSRRGPG